MQTNPKVCPDNEQHQALLGAAHGFGDPQYRNQILVSGVETDNLSGDGGANDVDQDHWEDEYTESDLEGFLERYSE